MTRQQLPDRTRITTTYKSSKSFIKFILASPPPSSRLFPPVFLVERDGLMALRLVTSCYDRLVYIQITLQTVKEGAGVLGA